MAAHDGQPCTARGLCTAGRTPRCCTADAIPQPTTVPHLRTWSKITDAPFFGVWVLTNTRWLAIGQLSSSPATPYDPRIGNQLLV